MTARAAKAPAKRTGRARERLVAAARAQLEQTGFQGLTVGAICAEADLSRATFYLHFATRDDVLLAVFLEEALAVITDAADVAARYDHFGELLVETLLHGMATIRENRWLRVLFSDESASVTARLASNSDAFAEMASAFWAPLVKEAQARGEVRAGLDPDAVLRWLLRVFLTYLEPSEGERPFDEIRAELETFLLPAFLAPGSGERPGGPRPETDQLLRTVEQNTDMLNDAVADLRRHVGGR